MKRLFLLGGFLLFGLTPVWAQRQLVDRVVAVVNDEAITQSELDLYLAPFFNELKKQYEGEALILKLNEARLKLLNQIIEDRLVLQEAKARGVTVDESEIDEILNQTKAKFSSESEFEEILVQQGYPLSEIRERYRRQFLIRRLHDQEIRSKIIVSPREIEAYYKNHASEFAEEEAVQVRSITIRKSEEASEKGLTDEVAKKKIESIRSRILAGERFEDLAQEFSEDAHAESGGMMGWVRQGEMLPEVEKPLFKLESGGISPILETAMGYHLFKAEEKKMGRMPPLEEIRNQIQDLLFRREAEKRFREWMEQLKTRAYISIR